MKLLTTLLLLLSFASNACDVTLSWIPPTENTDGSALTDLSHYVIAYGVDINKPDLWKKVSGTESSIQLVFASQAADYYFVIRAVNSRGIKSDKSNQTSKACVFLSKPTAPILNN